MSNFSGLIFNGFHTQVSCQSINLAKVKFQTGLKGSMKISLIIPIFQIWSDIVLFVNWFWEKR